MQKMEISGRTGRGYLAHNNREFFCRNVDPTRTQNNIVIRKEALESAYESVFGEAFQSYNSKVRKDRQFKGTYLEKLRASRLKHRQKEYFEWIVQVGNKVQMGYGSGNEHMAEEILTKYVFQFIERNPQLYVFNAVIHCDEATSHAHIDYIPWATYEKGQRIRNSLSKALFQMGYGESKSRKETNLMKWQKAERDHLRTIARERGLEIEDEKHNSNRHLEVPEFKQMQETKCEMETEIKLLNDEIRELLDIKSLCVTELAKAFKRVPTLITTVSNALKLAMNEATLTRSRAEREISR